MLILRAHAKINLALAVTARRDDGWHDIDSVVVPIDWHNLVGISIRAAPAPAITLQLTGPAAAGVPGGDANLAARAAAALCGLAGPLDIRIWLDKHVPHAAGLGSGSADAAATLRGGRDILASRGMAIDEQGIADAALSIGSDVPVLMSGCAQRVRGRGELLSSLEVPALDVVVVMTEPSSTAAAYAAVAPDEMSADGRIDQLAATLAWGHLPDGAQLGSALEPAAVRANPALAASLQRVRAVSSEHAWHMTGSGGAVFSIAPTRSAAESLARRVHEAGFAARACRTSAANL